MNIQSLSVVVPGKGCVNNCQCCVSKMSDDNKIYKNQLEENPAFYDLYLNDYIKPDMLFNTCRDMGADQITLRKLYDADDGSPQSQWIKENEPPQSRAPRYP
jgi:hypothetical protein